MKFEEWYDKTYPESVGKYDALHVACRSGAAFSWDVAREGYVKLDEVTTLLKEWVWCPNCMKKAIKEIKALKDKI